MARDARGPPEDRPAAPDLRREAEAELRTHRAALLIAAHPIWLDGALLSGDDARVPADDSALSSGLACYTTARFEAGRARLAARHAVRLARDAEALGLGTLETTRACEALAALGRAAFGDGAGVLRLQASRSSAGTLRLLGLARDVGRERGAWSALSAPVRHEGPGAFAGVKLTGHPRLALARALAQQAGCDEALLFDAEGRLVEGARTALVVVRADGVAVTPPAGRGGVASVALGIVGEAIGTFTEADLTRAELAAARELVALNAVRGAVAIVRLDGAPVGSGAPGPLATRLRAVLAAAE